MIPCLAPRLSLRIAPLHDVRSMSSFRLRHVPAYARCPKPVISAVHSACVGGGVDLVCATDIRLASSDAWFSIKEVGFVAGLKA